MAASLRLLALYQENDRLMVTYLYKLYSDDIQFLLGHAFDTAHGHESLLLVRFQDVPSLPIARVKRSQTGYSSKFVLGKDPSKLSSLAYMETLFRRPPKISSETLYEAPTL